MIFRYPKLAAQDTQILGLIEELRKGLRHQLNTNPLGWAGFLRRNAFARAVQGSNRIERISADLADAIAIVDEERPQSLGEEAEKALTSYRMAMTYVLRLHDDPHAQINAQLIRSLHFMMLNYDLTLLPGQWRHTPIRIVRDSPNEVLYEGPDAPQIPGLIEELVIQINSDGKVGSSILAAMAHLNLVMICPFRAGNGLIARALQTLVLIRNIVLDPVFCSIEEWLGYNANAYHAILQQVGKRGWHPERDPLPWVRFCLVAHYQQTATLMKRNIVIGRTWSEMEKLRKQHGLLERTEIAMMDAAFNYKVTNSRYRKENKISEVVASRDLRELCDTGLLTPIGEKRGRYYLAAEPLKKIMEQCADRSRAPNPYDLVKGRQGDLQLSLPV